MVSTQVFFQFQMLKLNYVDSRSVAAPKSKLTLGFFVSEKFFFKLNYIRFLLVVNNS